ncbi:MAG: flagellar protein [Nitrobacter sp. 62-13]|uniref:flagellin N-terminal helical domain-containing protein n=1 Tax=Nitrobacter sp. 62-13 TaxID=1895797 RepID=UPI00095F30F6|nr:flagellin [Nitrobacter sp. 62-13]OJU24752.1 MAG: flagellar protein [Nitrobacter sp. 62-13]
MSDIVLSASVRQNLLSLQSTADLLSTTQNRLATGNKVNTALDNPTNFFTAQGLNNRASDINNLLDSIGNGVQVLQAANTGITSIQKLVDTAKSIANQALQTPTGYSTKSEAAATITGATSSNLLGGTATAAVAASTVAASAYAGNEFVGDGTNNDTITIDGQTVTFDGTTDGTTAIADSTNHKYTVAEAVAKINHDLGATSSTVTAAVGTGADAGKIVLTNSATGTASNFTVDASSTTSGADGGFGSSAVTTTNGADAGTTGGLSGTTLSIAASSDGAIPAATINFGTGSGQVSTLDQLNTALATSNLTASVDSTGKITITTTNDHASATIGALSGTATGSGLFTAGAGSAPVADANSQNTRASLIAQYNQVIDQIKTTAQDSSFNGVNLLNGDQLKLVFNETGKSTLTIQGVTFDPAGLGLSSLTKGTDFLDNSNINTVLNSLNDASSTLRSQASAFGSNLSIVQIRQDFSKNLINVLQTGSSNLTLADTNEEAANSQALATRQSIAVSALALANQSQQSVLQLLR